ncbi:hypothetical protein [Aestuariivirga litoralis]|uniref:hypothetical protein n=1 Tax=Aestuariivirga litoralis TaxID=2650924 RepID=UPI0018C83DE3|nr:hypothetical protein [Aestuariivirga litoralis]MBG1231765.1 hypothetical protein [Aestuariivirga litoralis]
MTKFFVSIGISLLFVFLLACIYLIHVNFLDVNVVFYAALLDAAIAAVLAGLVLFAGIRALNGFEKLLLVVIWLMAGYALAISLPTVIDRSLSFYILEKLQQRGGGIRQDSFARVFSDEYMKEYRLVDVRLTEQLESGTITIKDGCVLLTQKGNVIASFGQYFRTHLLPKHRLLMGQYTGDLTNPFKNSAPVTDYQCGPAQ